MEELTNIWNTDDELNEQQLLNYIKGNASVDESHLVEKQMADSGFVNDAVEGLQSLKEKNLDDYVQQINKKLHRHLTKKKNQKSKRKIKDLQWVIIAVIIILLICTIAYGIIRMKQ
ncbi:MAG: hypothetical protein ABJA79_03925 [Parafilimonas sp.]